jgi:hypothetical protein
MGNGKENYPYGFASRSWGTRGPHDRQGVGIGGESPAYPSLAHQLPITNYQLPKFL